VDQRTHDSDPESVINAIQDVLTPMKQREWQAGIIVDEDEIVIGYSVYPITHLDGWQPIESINEALLTYYGAPVGEDAYNNAKKPVKAGIAEARAKLTAKLESLERSLKDDAEREVMRQSGELILAYQYTLEKGQTELVAEYDMDSPPLTIKLDPTLSPLDNAQRYFNQYNKAKRALEDVPTLIEDTQNELDYLDQLEMDLEIAINWPEIDDVQQALQSAGYWQGRKAKRIGGGGLSAPLRIVTQDGFVIWVGRNSRQNENVTFKKSSPEDLWLHARQVPGAHVIIKFDGRQITDELIEQAAGVAAYYSKRRNDGRVPVDVTRIKYVKKIKGAAQGMVTYRNERTLNVTPISEKDIPQA
jgi:predicted ribosome quality control (RQC) complex YloA/Tae2 family protein